MKKFNALLIVVLMSVVSQVIAVPPAMDLNVPHLNDRFDVACYSTANSLNGRSIEYARVQINDLNWSQHNTIWGVVIAQTVGEITAIGAVLAVEGKNQPIITPNPYELENSSVIMPGNGGARSTMGEFRDAIRNQQ
jgi:hypothetical protein